MSTIMDHVVAVLDAKKRVICLDCILTDNIEYPILGRFTSERAMLDHFAGESTASCESCTAWLTDSGKFGGVK